MPQKSIFRLAWGTLLLAPILAAAHGISDADKQRMLEGAIGSTFFANFVGQLASWQLGQSDHLLKSARLPGVDVAGRVSSSKRLRQQVPSNL